MSLLKGLIVGLLIAFLTEFICIITPYKLDYTFKYITFLVSLGIIEYIAINYLTAKLSEKDNKRLLIVTFISTLVISVYLSLSEFAISFVFSDNELFVAEQALLDEFYNFENKTIVISLIIMTIILIFTGFRRLRIKNQYNNSCSQIT